MAKFDRDDRSDWSGVDWFAWYTERAGILEYDEGLSRTEAEEQAKAELAELKRTAKVG